MQNFAFISRHAPTQGQVDIAAVQGIRLLHIGDMDGFNIDFDEIAYRMTSLLGDFDHTPYEGWRREQVKGVIVVHAGAALTLSRVWPVGVFENINRAPEGEKPSYEAGNLHVYYGYMEGAMKGYNDGYADGVAAGRTMC